VTGDSDYELWISGFGDIDKFAKIGSRLRGNVLTTTPEVAPLDSTFDLGSGLLMLK